jgi:hypothetical protein
MALKRILTSSDEYVQTDELPWANVYVKSVTDMEITYFVKALIVFDSGLMVITPCFKAFIHEGSKLHEHLMEALEIFIQQPRGTLDEMVAVLRKKGKIELLTDDSRKVGHWHKTENKYVQVYIGKADEENKAVNPFLAGMGLLGSHTHATASVEPSGVPKAVSKTSGKAARDV